MNCLVCDAPIVNVQHNSKFCCGECRRTRWNLVKCKELFRLSDEEMILRKKIIDRLRVEGV